ncbi:thermonuclease family protein [Glaesserella parasuis]|nr:hypothetical protein HPSH465_1374 [Glaesserella parasuis H465]MDP0381463.1 thermonuclease family protein [Glaesserella parasuis]
MKKTIYFHKLAILLSLFFSNEPIVAKHIAQKTCIVVGIYDGDTLTCLHNRTQLKVRLQYIDAPEFAQPFGNKAKQSLTQLAFKKEVELEITGYDKYQRLLAVVYDQRGENLNLIQVQRGMAWAYRQTQPVYLQAQQLAQQQRIGLWQDKNPINPADWRASKRSDEHSFWQGFSPKAPLATIDCNVRKSCNDLPDYDTAKRYFKQCRWRELDGNNDGIPCNKLYRKAQRQ